MINYLLIATRSVNRPTRNGTYIRFVNASTGTVVQMFDAGWEPNVVYTGYTIVIVTNYTWTEGATYYVLFHSGKSWSLDIFFPGDLSDILLGVASGVEFCGQYFL